MFTYLPTFVTPPPPPLPLHHEMSRSICQSYFCATLTRKQRRLSRPDWLGRIWDSPPWTEWPISLVIYHEYGNCMLESLQTMLVHNCNTVRSKRKGRNYGIVTIVSCPAQSPVQSVRAAWGSVCQCSVECILYISSHFQIDRLTLASSITEKLLLVSTVETWTEVGLFVILSVSLCVSLSLSW